MRSVIHVHAHTHTRHVALSRAGRDRLVRGGRRGARPSVACLARRMRAPGALDHRSAHPTRGRVASPNPAAARQRAPPTPSSSATGARCAANWTCVCATGSSHTTPTSPSGASVPRPLSLMYYTIVSAETLMCTSEGCIDQSSPHLVRYQDQSRAYFFAAATRARASRASVETRARPTLRGTETRAGLFFLRHRPELALSCVDAGLFSRQRSEPGLWGGGVSVPRPEPAHVERYRFHPRPYNERQRDRAAFMFLRHRPELRILSVHVKTRARYLSRYKDQSRAYFLRQRPELGFSSPPPSPTRTIFFCGIDQSSAVVCPYQDQSRAYIERYRTTPINEWRGIETRAESIFRGSDQSSGFTCPNARDPCPILRHWQALAF